MVMGFGSCLFECGNPNNSESAHDLDFPGAAVDDLGKRHYAALLSSRPTGSFRATPPPRLLHHVPGRAPVRNMSPASGGFFVTIAALIAAIIAPGWTKRQRARAPAGLTERDE